MQTPPADALASVLQYEQIIRDLRTENERLRNGCKMGEQAILAALPHADRIRDILFPMLADVRAAMNN